MGYKVNVDVNVHDMDAQDAYKNWDKIKTYIEDLENRRDGFVHEYQRGVLRTANTNIYLDHQILNAVLGINGEAGELTELIKKYYYHDKALDAQKVKYELGDIIYYISWLASSLNLPLKEIMEANQAKLRERYPSGFTTERHTL